MLTLITEPLHALLFWLSQNTGNLGVSIVLLTLIIRFALVPFTIGGLKTQKKTMALRPHVKELQRKHGKDRVALAQAQAELYKQHGINPLSLGSIVPMILQLIIMIALYQVLQKFLLEQAGVASVNFLGIALTQKDPTFVLPILAALLQLVFSVMLLPGADVRDVVPNDSRDPQVRVENKKEEDMQDMAETMQKQMVFILPLMTGFFAAGFPAGLSLYWVVTTLFSLVQQYFVSGWGGLTQYVPFLRAASPAAGLAPSHSTPGGSNPGQALQAAGGRRPGPQGVKKKVQRAPKKKRSARRK